MAYALAEWVYGTLKGYIVVYNSWQENDQFGTLTSHGEILSYVMWTTLPHLLMFIALAAVASVVGMKIFQAVKSRHIAA